MATMAVEHTVKSPFPHKAKGGEVVVVDERCMCGGLRSEHKDTIAYGHGPSPQHGCLRFSWVGFVIQAPGDQP